MSTAPGRLVLAITDPGLRSILAARLGMAGELPISTTNHLDPSLGKSLRANALLIIEDTLIGSPPQDWTETLRNHCWGGRIIIIADTPPDGIDLGDTIALVGRRDAGVAVLALVRRWQSQQRDPLNSAE